TSKTLSRLRQLADSAYAHSKWVLQYNDISLMYGGPFDVGKTRHWDTPHQTHREGRNVDMRPVSVSDDSIDVEWLEKFITNTLKGSFREEARGIQLKHHFHLGF
ncbi:MAG: hypothetical protein FJY85_15010, partial [Deltaproteobacteria bacterium]|nr:hypothetical protein [Deltaproteobacteria bacterium]